MVLVPNSQVRYKKFATLETFPDGKSGFDSHYPLQKKIKKVLTTGTECAIMNT